MTFVFWRIWSQYNCFVGDQIDTLGERLPAFVWAGFDLQVTKHSVDAGCQFTQVSLRADLTVHFVFEVHDVAANGYFCAREIFFDQTGQLCIQRFSWFGFNLLRCCRRCGHSWCKTLNRCKKKSNQNSASKTRTSIVWKIHSQDFSRVKLFLSVTKEWYVRPGDSERTVDSNEDQILHAIFSQPAIS